MSITAPHRRVLLAALTIAVVVGTAACAVAPTPPPAPATQPLAIWDTHYGWVDLPVTAAVAPAQRWRVDLSPDALIATDLAGTLLVTAEPTAGGTRVQSLGRDTGAPLWTADLPPDLFDLELVGAPPVAVAAQFGGGSRVVLLAPASGAVLSDTTATDGSLLVSGTADTVLLAALDGTTALDPAGGVRWTVPDQVTVADGELLAVGTGSGGPGTISVLDPASGRPRWSAPRPGISDTTVVDGRVITTSSAELTGELAGVLGLDPGVPSGSGDTARALDAATGAPVWTKPGLPYLGAGRVLSLGDDALLLTAGEDGAPSVALDAATGAVRWTAQEAPSQPVRVAGTPYVLETSARPAVHDAVDGRELVRIPDEVPFGSVVGYAGSVVLGLTGDDLVAYGLPDLVERWRVPVGPLYAVAPLDDGVLVHTADGLVALTGPTAPGAAR